MMRKVNAFTAAAVLALVGFGAANADMPGKHPYYLHALSDLRGARWLLQHRPGDARVSAHENLAIQAIDGAIVDIKKAAFDDGKDLQDHPQMDVQPDYPGRLHKASEILKKVHGDVNREEDDPVVGDLKHRSLVHIDEAIRQTDFAIADVERNR